MIPDSVTYVGANAFYWCKYVKTITFGENVAYVGEGVMSSFFIDPSVTKVVPEVRSATAGAAVRRSSYVGAMTRDGVNFVLRLHLRGERPHLHAHLRHRGPGHGL